MENQDDTRADASSSAHGTSVTAAASSASTSHQSSPATRIDSNSLAICFSFLLIAEKFIAGRLCHHWLSVSESRAAWGECFFFPATMRRLVRFPPKARCQVRTMELESLMERRGDKQKEAEESEEDEEGEKRECSEDGSVVDEESDVNDEGSDDADEAAGASSSSLRLFRRLPSPPSSTSTSCDHFRHDRSWLRMLRHVNRFRSLTAIHAPYLENNDVQQILKAVQPSRLTINHIVLKGICHPRRTLPSVQELRTLLLFPKLEKLALPYMLSLPVLKTLVQHSINNTTNKETMQGDKYKQDGGTMDAQKQHEELGRHDVGDGFFIEYVDEEAEKTLSPWVESWAVQSASSNGTSHETSHSSSMSSASSTSTPSSSAAAAPLFSLYPPRCSSLFRNLTSLGLKLWRPQYLSDGGCPMENAARKEEHIWLRQALSQLPALCYLEVRGLVDERSLMSVIDNPHISSSITLLSLGVQGSVQPAAWQKLSNLAKQTPKLETLRIRAALPNARTSANAAEEAEEKEAAGEASSSSTSAAQQSYVPTRGHNWCILEGLSHIHSLTSFSLQCLHAIDDIAIAIVYPALARPSEIELLTRLPKLQRLEMEYVGERTSKFLSRSFAQWALTRLCKPRRADSDSSASSSTSTSTSPSSLSYLTLFSPCKRELTALSNLPSLATLKLINTDSRIVLGRERRAMSAMLQTEQQTEAKESEEEQNDAEDEIIAAEAEKKIYATKPDAVGPSTTSSKDQLNQLLASPRRILHLPPLPSLTSLTVSNYELYPRDFAALASQPKLATLVLLRCHLGGVKYLDAMRDAEEGTKSKKSKRKKHSKNTDHANLYDGMDEEDGGDRRSGSRAASSSSSSSSSSRQSAALFPRFHAMVTRCLSLLTCLSSLTRLSLHLGESALWRSSLLPILSSSPSLTSLSITGWAPQLEDEFDSLASASSRIRYVEMLVCTVVDKQLLNMLTAMERRQQQIIIEQQQPTNGADSVNESSATQEASHSSRLPPPASALRFLMFVGCTVSTDEVKSTDAPITDANTGASSVTASASSSPIFHANSTSSASSHSTRPAPSASTAADIANARPFYRWSSLPLFLDRCFTFGIGVRHKRYY